MSRLYIFDALRSHLKNRGISFSELAFGLNVAEGTIKRIFTKNDCSTERLDEIAQYLDIHLVDLFQKAPPSKHLIDQLSYECEEQLAGNKKLLMLAICVMDFWPFKDMLKYTPESGRILIDGMDLNLVDTSWLRRQMGVVGQDTLLFNRSVRENIALADASLNMEAVMNVAKLAGAHEFILQLPEGYDTVIGERGAKLSGGQRARIAIARALATNPKLLLLDEATASLDYESERLIHDNMAAIAKGRTVVIVAHRLSTLRLADRILVLDKGRLIESGRHSTLMQQQGRYASLYRAHQVLEIESIAA